MTRIDRVGDLCIGCGTCVGVCPAQAVEMRINKRGFYVPSINERKCNHCGFCGKACPQINKVESFSKTNKFVFGKIPGDNLLGNYIDCYVGYTTDKNLRFEASSGGMITQLLVSALEEGIIDGALVTRMKKDNPLIPEPFIARTKEEIIEARGSKYSPVPANIVLREMIKSKDGERFAVVGLPCHIIGIRKAERLIPDLREKIVLHFGILCSGIKSFFGTEFILERKGVRKEMVKSIKYRGKGWPGYMQIEQQVGAQIQVFLLSPLYYGGIFPFFLKPACAGCSDFTAELSDISFGDAWNIEKEDTRGTSLLIVRTKLGEGLLNKVSSNNKVKLKNVERDAVVQSQELIRSRKKLLRPNTSQYIRDKIISAASWFCTWPYNRQMRKYCCLFIYLLILIKSEVEKLFASNRSCFYD